MPRSLKTFITNLGFFELAIAAPSMKAALEAWGMNHTTFQRGFARQTDDAAIVAATMAMPGTVLKRAVGSKGAFRENAELPKSLPNTSPGKFKPRAATPKAQPKAKGTPKAKSDPKAERATILSFQKAQAKRAQQRAEDEKKVAAQRAERRRAMDKAEAALEEAQQVHDAAMAAIAREREKLERRAEKGSQRWQSQREKLAAAVERARK